MADDTPKWQQTLVRWLGPAVCGVALNQLADVVPHLVVAVALAVVAILYGLSKLDATAPLVRGLPKLLLRVVIIGIVAAMLLPDSWAGPVIWSATGLIVLVVLLTRQRGTALASLIGISIFTYGVVLAATAPTSNLPGLVVAALIYLGVMITLGGLAVLQHPKRMIHPRGITVPDVRRLREFLDKRAGLLIQIGGFVALFNIGMLTSTNIGPAARAASALAMLTGLAVVGVEMVLWLPERHGLLVGVLLAVGGTSLTAASVLTGFAGTGKELVAVPILGALGLAMAGGGLSLLDATGTLPRLRRRLTYLVQPDSR